MSPRKQKMMAYTQLYLLFYGKQLTQKSNNEKSIVTVVTIMKRKTNQEKNKIYLFSLHCNKQTIKTNNKYFLS